MTRTFSAQVADSVRKFHARIEFTIKASAQDVFELAQTPRAKGGNLPVDTAFLRNSFSADIGKMPSGRSSPMSGPADSWSAPVALVIDGMRPGDTLFAGWSAGYARAMEDKYGFMKSAAMQWQSLVDKRGAEAIRRIR